MTLSDCPLGKLRRIEPISRARLRTPTPFCFVAAALACQSAAVAPTPPQTATAAPTCQSDQARLIAFVDALPDHGVAIEARSDLPRAALDGVIGDGHTLEVDDTATLLDGQPMPGGGRAARLAEVSAARGSADCRGRERERRSSAALPVRGGEHRRPGAALDPGGGPSGAARVTRLPVRGHPRPAAQRTGADIARGGIRTNARSSRARRSSAGLAAATC